MKLANERRAKPRINLKGTAYVFDAQGRQQVELRNLSACGVLVEMTQPPTKGEYIKLGICLDGRSWIELNGKVRRISKRRSAHECAIDLRTSTLEAIAAIDAYVQRVTTALSMAKQREIFAGRMAGVEHAPPKPTRDELIRQALPTAVLPPGSSVSTPPMPLPPRPASVSRTPTKPPEPEERPDPRLAQLYRKAVQDLDRKR